jgi:translation elongation factor P/translation initiation factor 5A
MRPKSPGRPGAGDGSDRRAGHLFAGPVWGPDRRHPLVTPDGHERLTHHRITFILKGESAMISTSDMGNGTVFEHEGAVYQIVWFQHHKPGKGGAMLRVKMRNVRTGSTIERTFKSGERFKEMSLARKPMQYLYAEGDNYTFSWIQNLRPSSGTSGKTGESVKFLTENMDVQASVSGRGVFGRGASHQRGLESDQHGAGNQRRLGVEHGKTRHAWKTTLKSWSPCSLKKEKPLWWTPVPASI